MSREIMQQALDALDMAQSLLEKSRHHKQILDAYIDLRQALAQPEQDVTFIGEGNKEQKPVAYLYHDASCAALANTLAHSTLLVLACDRKPSYRNETPLYTAPPRKPWVGLTDDDMHTIRDDAFVKNVDDIEWALQMVRRTEAKLKEKNHGL